jgi:glucokinase
MNLSLHSDEKNILVFDIGGTSLRGAIYCAQSGAISTRVVVPTPSQWSTPGLSVSDYLEQLLLKIQEVSAEISRQKVFTAVSLAFPGPIDADGNIVASSGIWGSNPDGPINILSHLKTLWPNTPVSIANDMTAAGFRYLRSSTDSFCLVTVSTGIGNKVFINGRPQLGRRGTGGEIGHIKVFFEDDAPLCDCGESGHLQAVSSGRGALNYIQRLVFEEPHSFRKSLLWSLCDKPQELTNVDVCKAFRAGDQFTVTAIEKCTRPLAAVLASLYMALGLERFIILGGFAFALGESYLAKLARLTQESCWNYPMKWDEMLEFGSNDDLSGLIGAGIMSSQSLTLKHL